MLPPTMLRSPSHVPWYAIPLGGVIALFVAGGAHADDADYYAAFKSAFDLDIAPA